MPIEVKYIPANIQPADHMSIEVEYILAPNSTSGGLYHSVTTWINVNIHILSMFSIFFVKSRGCINFLKLKVSLFLGEGFFKA